MTKAKAKKELLLLLADTLDRDDDLFPDLDEDSRGYRAYDAARTELSRELRSRAAEKTKVQP